MNQSEKKGARLVGLKQIAAYLDISLTTVRKYIGEGLPVHGLKVGKKPRYWARPAEIDAWLRKRDLHHTTGLPVSERRLEGAVPAPVEQGQDSDTNPNETPADTPKRALFSRRIAFTIAAVFALAAIALTLLSDLRRDDLPPYLLSFEGRTMSVISRANGDTLREVPGATEGNTALGTLEPHGYVIFFVPQSPSFLLAEARQLRFLSPIAEEDVRESEELRSCSGCFPEYKNFYSARVAVEDIDRDGSSEVIVTYIHSPNFPAYSVLYEPKTDRSSPVYASNGHHTFQGSVDLDDDGEAELLFETIANKLSWYTAIAAVKVDPFVGKSGQGLGPAMAPDMQPLLHQDRVLHWFALTAPGHCPSTRKCLDVDRAKRELRFERDNPITLTFDGFDPAVPSPDRPNARQELRLEVHRVVREARGLIPTGVWKPSLEAVSRALESSVKIGSPPHEDLLRVTQVQLLIAGGQKVQAKLLVNRLRSANSEFACEIAFEVATAFHLHEDVDEAIYWYRAGFGPGACDGASGRPIGEHLWGMILALGQQGKLEEARLALEQYGPLAPGDWARRLRPYLGWLENGKPTDDLPWKLGSDADHYWALQLRFAREGSSHELLESVLADLQRSSETVPLLEILAARLSAGLSLREEARELLKRAVPDLEARAKRHVFIAAHYEQALEQAEEARAVLAGRAGQ